MTTKVALIIIYNSPEHAGNIPVLEKIYKGAFSHIYHLVPGFTPPASEAEPAPNVIPVQGPHSMFHGFVAQGLQHYFREDYTHYFFIQDDLILNPAINENNFDEYLGLDDKDTAFFPKITSLHEASQWSRLFRKAYAFKGSAALPAYAEAVEKFSAHGLQIKPIPFRRNIEYIKRHLKSMFRPVRGKFAPPVDLPAASFRTWPTRLWRQLRTSLAWSKDFVCWAARPASQRELSYPLVNNIADICVVPAADIATFCRYCGEFAALKLHVELGMPTALVLACQKINTQRDDNVLLWGRYLWGEDRHRLLMKHERSLSNLRSNFPDNCLFLHPIKLAQWDTGGA